jgi:hypothetical protein
MSEIGWVSALAITGGPFFVIVSTQEAPGHL